jgi:hypothetical protein
MAATVHGFNIAMIWGAAILIASATPIATFINANPPHEPA